MLHCFSFVTIVPWFLCFFFLSLGFALHYIHAFHSRCFYYYLIYIYIYIIKKKERKEGKRKHIVVLALFSLFLKTRLINLFSHDMSYVPCLALMSLLITIVLKTGLDRPVLPVQPGTEQ